MAKLVRDRNPGAHEVRVLCLACGHWLYLSEALIDLDGPAFEAYYHAECAPAESGLEVR
jgi:hypothetical protein